MKIQSFPREAVPKCLVCFFLALVRVKPFLKGRLKIDITWKYWNIIFLRNGFIKYPTNGEAPCVTVIRSASGNSSFTNFAQNTKIVHATRWEKNFISVSRIRRNHRASLRADDPAGRASRLERAPLYFRSITRSRSSYRLVRETNGSLP